MQGFGKMWQKTYKVPLEGIETDLLVASVQCALGDKLLVATENNGTRLYAFGPGGAIP